MPDALPLSAALPVPVARLREIRDEQIRIFYQNIPAQLVSLLVGVLLALALWGITAPTVLGSWCAALAVVAVLRALSFWSYRRSAVDRYEARWRTYAVLGAAGSGLVWGVGGAVLYPAGSFEYQLLVLFVLVWLGAGAVTSLSVYLPAFFAYFPFSMLPITGSLLTQADRIHVVLGIIAIIYVVALSFYARGLNRSLVETLKLRFENVDLVAELARKSDEAERANVGKSKFLAAASHDLRQPLHALGLFTSVLSDQATEPKTRAIVDKIDESVRALLDMFDVLLDVSRLDAGVLRPMLREFHLRNLCARLAGDFGPEADARGLQFTCDVGDVVVRSDPALLEQILRNLVANAVRYTVRGTVRVDCVNRDSEIEIRVTDTGVGIPADQQRAIFEEFHQLGNPERDRSKGLGMGLAIVDRVAKLLDHAVRVDSAPGKGSCFAVTVPRGETAAIMAEGVVSTIVPGDLTGLLVVVIDDDGGARTAMASLLEHWGCKVVGVGSQAEALAALRSSDVAPNAIVADYRLRNGRDGAEAIAAVRNEFGDDIPALIVTGDIAVDRLREIKASGHQVVHKPVPPVTLRAFLANARARTVV